MSPLRFIDLFAGLGGFHQALARLGHKCVFASELNQELARLYHRNFGIFPYGDIRSSIDKVPQHDVLCAGFPCQPFSKAGEQLGFDCPQWGDLFEYVLLILDRHKPRFLIIENVPNLMRHNRGTTWENIQRKLRALGYAVSSSKLSPHSFGVPQVRDRAIIVGCRDGLQDFRWPSPSHQLTELDIRSVLDVHPPSARTLPQTFLTYLEVWQKLIDALPAHVELPSFPIWAMEFGADYPTEGPPPSSRSVDELRAFKGAFGRPLEGNKSTMISTLPNYAQTGNEFPNWKRQFIQQNRDFYKSHQTIIDRWLPQVTSFAPSFQKLEWNWKGGPRNLFETIVQFRASGIRAKRTTAAPSLVALTTSQVPVIPWERRYMTMRECARLQSMDNLEHLPTSQTSAHRALGNAVNVVVIENVAKVLLSQGQLGGVSLTTNHNIAA